VLIPNKKEQEGVELKKPKLSPSEDRRKAVGLHKYHKGEKYNIFHSIGEKFHHLISRK
jgi:hypothetical protein